MPTEFGSMQYGTHGLHFWVHPEILIPDLVELFNIPRGLAFLASQEAFSLFVL